MMATQKGETPSRGQEEQVSKEKQAEQAPEKGLFLEQNLEREKEARPERLEKLRKEVERLFPGDTLAPIREKIERSFDVPQLGKYHNEGMLMDSHLEKILGAIDAIKDGEISMEIPPYIREKLQSVVLDYEEEVRKYALLHDISKADRLKLKHEGEKKARISHGRNGRPWYPKKFVLIRWRSRLFWTKRASTA